MSRHDRLVVTVAIFAASIWAGCSTGPEDGTTGDDQDITGSECEITVMASGKKMSKAQLDELDDPVARFVLAGKACPTTFEEITRKMAKTDVEGDCAPGFVPPPPCSDDDESCEGPGREPVTSTQLVSETSQVLGKPDAYRAVFQRRCGKRAASDFFISAFGLRPDAKSLPVDVELIGRDATSGAFNYYAREKGAWRFFGTSRDFVAAGYDCVDGSCTSKAADKQRCAGCHPGGGLVMKELESPWVHWEGSTETPGTDALISRFPVLGEKRRGPDLEGAVVAGNQRWLPKRVAIAKEQGVAEVLRPLFCTLDVNIEALGDPEEAFALRGSLFLDPIWDREASRFVDLAIDDGDYATLRKANNQRIVDGSGKALGGARGPVDDTFFGFSYPARLAGTLDHLYVRELIEEKIIDLELAKDVLHVDFTRPIFSKTRCDLLQHAPRLEASRMTPAAIRDGFKVSLRGKPGAASQLLQNLEATNDAAAHEAEVDAFINACAARPRRELLADAMAWASQQRRRWRGTRIAEFSQTLAVDDLPRTEEAFDPATCTLRRAP